MKISERLRRLLVWLDSRAKGRRQVPTDLSDKIREGIGPRVVKGPAGLHSTLYDTVLGRDDPSP